MKKLLISLAAVAALAAGASAAQAKVHFDVNVGLPGFYVGNGYGYGGPVYVADDYGYDEPSCHYVKVKKVKWVDGYKVVTFKKKLVCNSY
jgi:opacity protein-like surface antigen